MLVLDEYTHAKTLLKNNKYGNYIKLRDLVLLAKYYYKEGKSTREIKKILRTLCKKVDRTWNETTQDWKVKIAIREAKKRRIRVAIPIPITVAELEKLKKINDCSLEKILFVFIVYAKFLKYSYTLVKPRKIPRLIGSFYINEKSSNIFSVAKVDVRKKKRNEMMHVLYEKGYLDANRYNGFILKCIVEDSPTAFVVEDYENIVLYYQREKGETVAGCSCGRLFLKRFSKDMRCHYCKQEKRREKWKEQQKKHRQKEKIMSAIK